MNLPRVEAILSQENPLLTGQDTDSWAAQRRYSEANGMAAFGEFVAARLRLVERLGALSPQEWQRPARHTIFGPTRCASRWASWWNTTGRTSSRRAKPWGFERPLVLLHSHRKRASDSSNSPSAMPSCGV